MKYTSPVYSAASGSIAGVTYSRNKGGNYTRSRAIPSNPNSASQVGVRSNLSVSSQAWGALTANQRAGWNALAPTVSWTNTLGQSIQLSGLNLFNQVNALRLLVGLAVLESAPADATRADVPIIGTTTLDAGSLSVSTTNNYGLTDYLAVFISRPSNPGRSPTTQPYRQLGSDNPGVAGPIEVQAVDPFASASVGQFRAFRCVIVSSTLLPSPSVIEVREIEAP